MWRSSDNVVAVVEEDCDICISTVVAEVWHCRQGGAKFRVSHHHFVTSSFCWSTLSVSLDSHQERTLEAQEIEQGKKISKRELAGWWYMWSCSKERRKLEFLSSFCDKEFQCLWIRIKKILRNPERDWRAKDQPLLVPLGSWIRNTQKSSDLKPMCATIITSKSYLIGSKKRSGFIGSSHQHVDVGYMMWMLQKMSLLAPISRQQVDFWVQCLKGWGTNQKENKWQKNTS